MLVKGLILGDLGLRLNTAYSWMRPRTYFSDMCRTCIYGSELLEGIAQGARDLSRNDGVLRMN